MIILYTIKLFLYISELFKKWPCDSKEICNHKQCLLNIIGLLNVYKTIKLCI